MLLTSAPVAAGMVAQSRAAPRLACVKPVASVHPEPGSNSSLLYYRFYLLQDYNENATAMMSSARPGTVSRGAVDSLCSYSSTCHLRNLDVDSGVSFPCLCTVNFLIANISMNSRSRFS